MTPNDWLGYNLHRESMRRPGETVTSGRFSARFDTEAQVVSLFVDDVLLLTIKRINDRHNVVTGMPSQPTHATEKYEFARGFCELVA